MTIFDDIEAERDRIQNCIQKFGWTSDHNLDWFLECAIDETGKPMFVEFDDGSGLLVYRYPNEWSIWSDPLSKKNVAPDRILEFVSFVPNDKQNEVWCVDVSDNLRDEIIKKCSSKVGDIWYSLFWPILDMVKYDPTLSGGDFKRIRNTRNKFYKEHRIEIAKITDVKKDSLHEIVNNWKREVSKKQADIYDLKYHKAIDDGFRGFISARVVVVDGRPIGINAGYEVPNKSERFAGVIGIHDYSLDDLGLILWLEDLEWIKNAGYKELDMQGSEGGGLKFKMQFNPTIERKTDTFCIKK